MDLCKNLSFPGVTMGSASAGSFFWILLSSGRLGEAALQRSCLYECQLVIAEGFLPSSGDECHVEMAPLHTQQRGRAAYLSRAHPVLKLQQPDLVCCFTLPSSFLRKPSPNFASFGVPGWCPIFPLFTNHARTAVITKRITIIIITVVVMPEIRTRIVIVKNMLMRIVIGLGTLPKVLMHLDSPILKRWSCSAFARGFVGGGLVHSGVELETFGSFSII